jgi:hypothetical protein
MHKYRPSALRATVVSAHNVAHVISQVRYATIGFVSATLALGLLSWIPNLGLLWSVLTAPMESPGAKIAFALAGYESLTTNYSFLGSLVLVTFAVLTGLNIALVMFVTRASYRAAAASGTSTVGALVLAAAGAGCAACGTSFVTPLLGGLAATATIGLTNILGVVIDLVGIALLLYSILRLGLSAQRFSS